MHIEARKMIKFYRHYNLKILMVTDQGGSFGKTDFGLSEVLETLSAMPSWVKVTVTRAHRGIDPFDFDSLPPAEKALLEPRYEGFRFTQPGFDLSEFDQVWLIGVARRGHAQSMSDPELRVLTQFMDAGGGVFSTGDHEDLGYALSGRVPRVRSMRKWYWSPAAGDGPSIDGSPPQLRAPDGGTANRYDTLREGDPGYQFEDQSDTVPQDIDPVLRTTRTIFHRIRHPHPLLCGPRGIIRVLPDHPHEGECVVPSDLSKTYTFAGYSSQEYRTSSTGVRPRPEIVAHAHVIGGHATPPKPPVVGRRFGVIGAYDGHVASVGRVCVDATWHHFFNINLVGDPGAPTAEKRTGFPATAAGQAAYEDIQAYFRNIAIWLSPRPAQAAMMSAALWNSRFASILIENLHPQMSAVLAGTYARDALGRLASRCQTREWIHELIEIVRIPPELILPPPRGVDRIELEPDASVVADIVLGSVMQELIAAIPVPDASHSNLSHEHVLGVVRKGALRSSRALSAHLESEARDLPAFKEWTEKLSAHLDAASSAL